MVLFFALSGGWIRALYELQDRLWLPRTLLRPSRVVVYAAQMAMRRPSTPTASPMLTSSPGGRGVLRRALRRKYIWQGLRIRAADRIGGLSDPCETGTLSPITGGSWRPNCEFSKEAFGTWGVCPIVNRRTLESE